MYIDVSNGLPSSPGVEETASDLHLKENISVVEFGKNHKVVQHLTNDYGKVRTAISEYTYLSCSIYTCNAVYICHTQYTHFMFKVHLS